ncbi:MAG: DUF4861 domain-containing protein [bacterium]
MKSLITFCAAVFAASLCGCAEKNEGNDDLRRAFPGKLSFSAKNTTPLARHNAAIVVATAKLKAEVPEFNDAAFVILAHTKELASQANDVDGDGKADEIVCVADFAPNEAKALIVHYAKSGVQPRAYPKRTQAELSHKAGGNFINRKYDGGVFQNVQFLRVPPEHTDHSLYIRYEGPGWESDKIGYRFYLDWRNATDIFGKKTPAMVLQDIGQDGFDSYHEISHWGMDILKVGESLGLGSLAMWHEGKANRVAQTDSVTCAIISSGPVQSQIQTKYFGWKIGLGSYNVASNLSITAGSRLTKHTVEISGNPQNLCTGIVKLDSTTLLSSPEASEGWAYLATYGKQSLAADLLGMAILYRQHDLIEVTEDQHSHVVVLRPVNGQLTYYFLGAWEQEPDGIKSAEVFESFLKQTVAELDSPLTIDF